MAQQDNNLLIIGAGQYGLVAFEIAQAMGCFGKIAFLDDSYQVSVASHAACHPERSVSEVEGSNPAVIGSTRDIERFSADYHYGFVAIGNPDVRRKLTEQLRYNSISPAVLVHPSAYVSPCAQLQEGVCIEPNATVQTCASIGTSTFVASGAVIRHNAFVGDFCHIDCNAVVESGAVVPTATKVPCNSVFAKVQGAASGALEGQV